MEKRRWRRSGGGKGGGGGGRSDGGDGATGSCNRLSLACRVSQRKFQGLLNLSGQTHFRHHHLPVSFHMIGFHCGRGGETEGSDWLSSCSWPRCWWPRRLPRCAWSWKISMPLLTGRWGQRRRDRNVHRESSQACPLLPPLFLLLFALLLLLFQS